MTEHNWSRPEWLAPEWERCAMCAAVRLTGSVYTKPCRGHIGPAAAQRTAIERLADDIDKRLANGERVYLIRGAELDWVRDAIRVRRYIPMTERMRDRVIELAACLICNPWVDKAVQNTCEALLRKWEAEDLEKALSDIEAANAASHGECAAREK